VVCIVFMTVNKQIQKGNYHSVTIIHEKFTLILRPPRKSKENKILKMPIWCEDIGWYPVKAAEIKREGEITLYV
jgi:hypothetical protein